MMEPVLQRCWSVLSLAALALFTLWPVSAYAGVVAVTQQNYDELGRVKCVVTRMNAAVFNALPADACALGTEGSQGPDRITRNVYDDAGQLLRVQRAYGTPLQQDYATYTYTPNGQRASVEDANGNRSVYTYDGLDRLVRMNFPSPTTPHTANANDYEAYGYDANNNRTSLRLRSNHTITSCFDFLNRETYRNFPDNLGSPDRFFGYDSAGHRLFAREGATPQSDCMAPVSNGSGVEYGYDAIGRLASETSYGRQLSYLYGDKVNRTRVTWPDTFYAAYTYDAANRMLSVGENGATSGPGLLAVYAYDALGRRQSISRGNGTVTTYAYDGISRLSSLDQNLASTANDQTFGFGYTASSQIASRSASNDAYHWAAPALNVSYTPNGLNQYASVGGASYSYDARGNLTSTGSRSFSYDLENHLLSVNGGAFQLGYDPLGRLRQTSTASSTTSFLYDGDQLVAEYDGAALQRRYLPGAGVDEPLVWYEGSGSSDRRYLIGDNQGTIIAADGSAVVRYAYGPYGEPNAWSGARFRYTGQIALPEAQLYHYKARVYDPVLGRFLQTDPVGYEDDLNLYQYAVNDPMNKADPTGEWVWVAVGAVISGGVQAYSEYRAGTLNSWQGAGRVALAAGAGAVGGGAAGAIGRAIVGEGAAFIAGRAAANAAVGAATGAGQAEGNARIESGGQRGATREQLVSGAAQGAAFSAGGSAAGDVAAAGAFRAAGGAAGEARAAAAESERLVQGQGMPGGNVPGAGPYSVGPSPTPPSQVGAVVGQGTGAVVGGAQPPARSCPGGTACPR